MVDLLTKAGLIRHLGELEIPPHPGEALTAFREALGTLGTTQSVLITHRDAVGDPEFRRALERAGGVPGFLAVVDREGHFELHTLPLGRSQPLCSALLDLETIFAERKPAVSLVDKRYDPGLPVIFQVRPFPLLLPVKARVEKCRRVGTGGVCITEDARLLLWRRADEGARQLAAGIPGQHTAWLHADEQGRVTALRLRPQEGCLWIIRAEASTGWQACRNDDYLLRPNPGFFEVLKTDLVSCFRIEPAVQEAIRLDHGMLLLIGPVMTIAIDPVSGETLSCKPTPPGLALAGGRYFVQGTCWHFVSWNGKALVWEPVSLPPCLQHERVLLLFDREGCEGPLAVASRGAVLTCSGECVFQAAHSWDMAISSPDGHRLLVREAATQTCHKLDLELGNATVTLEQTFESAKFSLESAAPIFPSRPLWTDFKSICVREPGILTLRRSRGEGIQVGFNAGQSPFIAPFPSPSAWPASNIHFRPAPAPPEIGCTLQVAEWPNGSRAFLDSRGLLHLRSHDPAVAEVTLVLAFGLAAVWSSEGLVCGPRFFVGDAPTVKPEEMRRRIVAFVDRLW